MAVKQDTRGLEQRRLTWFAVKYVPEKLHHLLPRKLCRTLETRDLTEAQKRRWALLAEFQKRIDDAETAARDATKKLPPSPYEAEAEGWREALAEARRGDVDVDDEGIPAVDVADLLADRAETVAARQGAATAAPLGAALRGETPILQHVPAWLREGGQKGSYAGRSKVMHERNLEALKAWLAREKLAPTVEAVTRRTAGRYITQSLVASGRHPKTINCILSSYRAYWTYLAKRGLVPDDSRNPWAGQSLPKGTGKGTGEETERAFTDAEVIRLLSGPADPELADLMRVGALSGMRIEETYRLQVRDCADGVFRIRQGKTLAAIRRVPVHPDLAGIVAARVKGKPLTAFLFHEAGEAKEGRERSMAASKRFGRYRQRPGVDVHEAAEGKRRGLVNYHSFRRWFITATGRAGQAEGVIGQVVGHKPQGMTMGVYFGGYEADALRACVDAVRLPVGGR